MRRFALASAAGLAALLVTALVACLVVCWMVPWWLERSPSVSTGTTLILRISGSVVERERGCIPLVEDGGPWTTWRLSQTLHKAEVDPRIAALLLLPEGVSAGWAQLGEIRTSLSNLARKKAVVAYVRSPGSRDYYLASAAGRIAGPPGDYLNIKGFRAELLYARGLLDKLGIVPEFEAMGRYKDAPDTLTRSSMRPETREVVEGLLDARYNDWSTAVAEGRKKTSGEVKRLIDEGPFLSEAARKGGLTDAVEFEEQTRLELAKRLGQKELKTLDATDYQRISAKSLGLEGRHRVALLVAEGDIVRDRRLGALTTVLDPDEFKAAVKRVREDAGIRAVVLRIDSPGGDAIASEEMTHEVKLLAEKKPVIVSMGDVAASAGYQIAMPGHWVIADPRTVTGSIGVFFGKVALAGLYSKLGLNKEVITRGRFAAIDSDVQPLTAAEREKLRSSLEGFYREFVRQVSVARKRPYEQIEAVAQGRVWLGAQAKERGLVDEVGGLGRAITVAAEKSGVAKGEGVRVEVYPEKPGVVEAIRERTAALGFAGFEARGMVWKRLPFAVEVK